MKLLTFLDSGQERLGWLQDDLSTVLVPATDTHSSDLPRRMMDVIAGGADTLANFQAARPALNALSLDDLTLLPPAPKPDGIFCVGLNYSEHEREAPVAGTDYPTIFLRLARNQIAHGEPMITPQASATLDWEGELVAVIGKPGRHIAPADAFDHIFGYSIYNEASVRAFQHHSSQFGMGKNFEGTGAFGPWLVTADAFGDPYTHHIETTLDGEVVQRASIDDMTHRIEDVIAYLSQATTLMRGDVICTGTPSGVGAARKPPRFMQAGETVSVSITGIGTLTNPIHAEGAAASGLSQQKAAV